MQSVSNGRTSSRSWNLGNQSIEPPRISCIDEPRQQETAKVSFRRLLERAATSKQADGQVIFATSEDREQLDAILQGLDCRLIPFDGPIVQRLA